ncbi:Na(+)-translocating NADH-quinone reductase subunit A [Candidatus Protochlamydia phocaeensis]|uniref:Na(+)-translocating NADH-quinone reductase subunit A n=1 Tax=Candidatus Protochlamydia phocaeensis TaxID=1414722 RepID=UPI0008381F91|nr:Na(+)-translocating NADH-quinone reductase subunit A [Candidatus Protochlamydia phocaeensis]
MVHIKIAKGLDIPIKGKPDGGLQPLTVSGGAHPVKAPSHLALDFNAFEEIKFKILVKAGDYVKIGQPLAEDKASPGRFFVSPAAGTVIEIRRGLKRRLLDIVIEVATAEERETYPLLDLSQSSRQELIDYFKRTGLFAHIRQRPFNFLANPGKVPRSIFVKALESAPFVPPAEMQVAGYEKEFQRGLDALAKMTDGKVHLVYRQGTASRAFPDAKGVEKHTAEGPHPISNPSLHIQRIDPILSVEDVVWTVDVLAVIVIGYMLMHGQYFVERIISLAGTGIVEGRTGYFKVREGYPISALIAGRIKKGWVRLIAGDPLTGRKVDTEDFLGYYDKCFCAIPENTEREFLHFFRLGLDKYTFSGTYLSGHLDNAHKEYDFTTNQHGELRPFIDSSLADEVMPLDISTVHLVKAILAEDYDQAAELGLLEVDSEDFALPSFVCPSKIEMTEIVKEGLRRYAADMLK